MFIGFNYLFKMDGYQGSNIDLFRSLQGLQTMLQTTAKVSTPITLYCTIGWSDISALHISIV